MLCVDEKSQVQALNRTQPILPLAPGLPARQSHDYERHGVTSLFAALDVASGVTISTCYRRHRHQEFLRFLNDIDANLPGDFDVHLAPLLTRSVRRVSGSVVCWACSAAWRCKSSGQPDGGEGLVMMQRLPPRGGV